MKYTRISIIATDEEKYTRTCSITMDDKKIKERAAEMDYDDVREYLDYLFSSYSFNELCGIIPHKDDGVLCVRYESIITEKEEE